MALQWLCLLSVYVVGLIYTVCGDGHPPVLPELATLRKEDLPSARLSVSQPNPKCPSPTLESDTPEDVESRDTEGDSLLGETSSPSKGTSSPLKETKKARLCKSKCRRCVYFTLYFVARN